MAMAERHFSTYLLRFAAVLASLLAISCSLIEKKPAILWTDTPEILIAVEMFNASQSRHLIEVHYVGNLAETLDSPAAKSAAFPSIVVGKGLRTQTLGDYFQSLEYLFGELVLSKSAFYPALLQGGTENSRQMLVPVSFNPMLILSGKAEARESGMAELDLPPAEKSAITMEEMQRRAILFNGSSTEAGERMGFSPRWPDKDFLFQWIQLKGAAFGENRSKKDAKNPDGENFPLSWDQSGLEGAIASLHSYVRDVNGSAAVEDAFAFKNLRAPGYKNVETGKILFAAMNSAAYFTLSPLVRSKYDFKYFSEKGRLALSEDIKYAGIPRRAPNKEAAEQFLRWFYNPDHQKAILEKSRDIRLSESAFGVAGGFSPIQTVTETLFPTYYGDLRGNTPPKAMIVPPKPMPPAWDRIKADVIRPWLDDSSSRDGEAATTAVAGLKSRLEAYLDKNPDLRSESLR